MHAVNALKQAAVDFGFSFSALTGGVSGCVNTYMPRAFALRVLLAFSINTPNLSMLGQA